MLSKSKVSVVAVFAVLFAFAANMHAKTCQSAGGMLMTDLGAVDSATTMGVATGDLKGAVGATIQSIDSQDNGATLIFTVQHHWVSESGDQIFLDKAVATAVRVGGQQSTLYAVVSYPSHVSGGTGRFAGATGDFNDIGEVDLGTGQSVFRYSGTLCFAQKNP
jgi:hypothetical protein